jgi:hypothetical protein
MYPDYERLHNFYSLQSTVSIIKSRKMEWARHAARMGEMRDEYRMLFGKHEEVNGKRNSRCENNIKM